MALVVKNHLPMQEARDAGSVSLVWEDPLEEGMATRQNSCLENPVDRGAWWITVYGVTKSQT